MKFISSFLSDRSRSLCFPGFSSAPFSSDQGVHLGSLFSPTLFLFYNADLIDVCNSPDLRATSICLVDEANVLAFGKSTEETCSVLKEIHSRRLTWGDMHCASFVPHKYVFVHFHTKKRNLTTTPIGLPTFILHPSPYARELGLILDSKLSWNPHIALIKSKLRIQTFALTGLTSSTR